MRRSEINRALRDMGEMVDRCSFKLPPFHYFTPEEWKEKRREYDEVRNSMLGWDIMDFGMRDFNRVSFSLITLRNSSVSTGKYTEPYTEKLLYMKERQSAAMRFRWNKTENIINRGRGNVLIGVYSAGKEEGLTDTDVLIHSDGREYAVPTGTQMRLRPGESTIIQPRLYHGFHLEPSMGPVLLGEISIRNDDNQDNRFYLPAGRFPAIEEGEPPFHLLCNEYPPAGSCTKR